MTKIYGIYDQFPTERELRNRALARKAARESFVLLKNDNALPIRPCKIALYGMGARKTVKGGLGSGSVEERYSVNIEDGLKNAGFEIATEAWLSDYDAEFEKTYEEYRQMVNEKIKDLRNPMQIIPVAHSYVYRYPGGRTITRKDIEESNTDTAIYVLMRQAGEGNDRKLEKGDWYLTDGEYENIKIVAENYKRTILVINVGGLIDMSFLDEIEGIDAVVQFVQGGEEGGNALADVLSGKCNFCGKLADTIPLKYEDIPYGGEFSYLNGDTDNEYYKEGIYVGYRYYDSFDKEVRFPFGFGLSYTQFTITPVSAQAEGSNICVRVEVENKGSCSGREVVQLYVCPPRGETAKAKQQLAAFRKTRELAPGEKQILTLFFQLEECAFYCEKEAAWKLDSGMYTICIGNSSRNTRIAAAAQLAQGVVTRRCANKCVRTDCFDELYAQPAELELPADVTLLEIKAEDIFTETVDYTDPAVEETSVEKAVLDMLGIEGQLELLRGGDLQNVPAGAHDIHGAAGKTATTLLDKGVGNVCFSDGPAGINIVNKVRELTCGGFAPEEIPERYRWGMLEKIMEQRFAMLPLKPETIYRYATAWPVEMLLAQSWDTELLYEIGKAAGEEAALFGITVWLAPGMNIHRNPLGGRCFEYYSEDPVLTGEMAAALTNGVQANPGVGVSAKHFCCNNTEDNRNGISSNVSEQALREIYLKGFEICVKEAQPMTVMTSYNMLNHVYTANSHDLVTDILRCEFGFRGLVMTDWGSCTPKSGAAEACAPAGNDLVMPGGAWDKECMEKAVTEGTLTAETIRKCACRVIRLLLAANNRPVNM